MIRSIIALLAAVAAPISPALADKGLTPAGEIELVPLSPPVTWVTSDDYPPQALRAGEQGKVRLTLTIGVNGMPRSCHVDQSSGSTTLDERTCSILMARAQFQPPKDPAGKPTEATFTRNINWAIPTYPGAVPVWVKITAANGRYACSGEVRGVPRKLSDEVCQSLGQSVTRTGRSLNTPILAQLPDGPPFLLPAGQ